MIHQALALPRPILTRGFGCDGDVFVHQCRTKNRRIAFCASDDQIASSNSKKTRSLNVKVVEHVCLLKAKANLPEEVEKDMLDYLYTTQYQMRGIVATSVGCINDRNNEDYTHALFMRFQRKEDLNKFYENPFFLKVLNEYVTPFCHGLINVDYESEVEDDILAIFRKGEEYNYGEEFILLVTFSKNTSNKNIKDATDSFAQLTASLPSLVVQSTQGSNINKSSKEFTYAAVVRFRSFDAMEIFVDSRGYKDMWKSQFEPFVENTVALHFSIDPVGTDVM